MQKAVCLNSLCSINQSRKTIIAYFPQTAELFLDLIYSICSTCLVDDCSLCHYWMCACVFAGLSGGGVCLTWNYGGYQSCAVVIHSVTKASQAKGLSRSFSTLSPRPYCASSPIPSFKVSGLTFSSFSWQIEKMNYSLFFTWGNSEKQSLYFQQVILILHGLETGTMNTKIWQ